MRITWDPDKARANFEKHGVYFADAEGVLYDPQAITREDTAAQGEVRLVSVGLDWLMRPIVVVYTHRGEELRLISARPATRKEKRAYEKRIRL
jgi:uncharacterized DUF497 family protein